MDPIGEMAVVIQEMVDAEVAGVIFTRHPTSGSPASITITANYGLGEVSHFSLYKGQGKKRILLSYC